MKILLIIIIYFSFSFTQTIDIKYDISFGFFGKIGEAKLKVRLDKSRYLIDIRAYFIGFYKKIFDNLNERYISIGTIKNNVYFSHKYISVKNKNNNKKVTKFMIDYNKKEIFRIYEEYKKKKLFKSEKNILPKEKFSSQDILNIFFNINRYIKQNGKPYQHNIIGIEKKQQFEISIPSKKIINNYSALRNKKFSKYLHIILNQDFLLSKKGEIITGLSKKDNFLDVAIIKDILLIGDITIKRVN